MVPHADLRILDPLQAAATITTMHASNIYDQLFAWDVNLQSKPQMISDYKVSDDKLTYTMTLRPGLKFHDGSPVRAADVVASVKRWMVRDTAGRKLAEFLGEIKVVDDNNVAIVLKQPAGWVEFALGASAGTGLEVVRYDPYTDRPFDVHSGRWEWYDSYLGRITWQATPKNKFNFLVDHQMSCNCGGTSLCEITPVLGSARANRRARCGRSIGAHKSTGCATALAMASATREARLCAVAGSIASTAPCSVFTIADASLASRAGPRLIAGRSPLSV